MKNFIRMTAISATFSAAIFCGLHSYASAEPVTAEPSKAEASKAEADGINALAVLEVRAGSQSIQKMNAFFKQVRGTYLFDQDDRSITLYRSGSRFYAEISGQPSLEIVAVDATTFASKNGDLELVFKEQVNGQINNIVVRMPKEKMQFALK